MALNGEFSQMDISENFANDSAFNSGFESIHDKSSF